MSKAEKFIQDYTRNCSNVFINPQLGGTEENYPWLTPDDARKAVEIAREDIYVWLDLNAHLYIEPIETIFGRIEVFNTDKLIKDLKQAMKNE
jgi:hypothetical protein